MLWIIAASGVHSKQVHELRSFLDYFEPLMEFMASLPPEERVFARQLGSFMDTKYIFADRPNSPPTSMLYGPDILSTNLYQLSPSEDLIPATLARRPFPLRIRDDGGTQNVVVTKEKYGSVPRIYIVCG
ncbi:hypothetical protein GH714_013566 [Hevea brasiliensis]|uniref:Uncharacterized protein n=1 Tax=Hevea brasiliensis TaxID=3981 RepID=A0A6A6K543_HEVBR|nr:hypothetical protein GH714_013566 [Hevea brasiliensis]